ncbi:MAG: ACP S-malonyltransferase [Rhodococcus sp.]|nr:ACP S-malonyltransferase [Rhodococcus sp. (in: high G+C Gram-positive bacteria)]
MNLGHTWSGSESLSGLEGDYSEPHVRAALSETDTREQRQTRNAQIALWVEQALWRREVLSDRRPNVVAGHSTGEVYALHLAGVLSESDSLDVIDGRSRAMAEAVRVPGTMMAVLGFTYDGVREVLEQAAIADLWVANVNSDKQVVLSGTTRAVEKALPIFDAIDGVRVKVLDTGGAFHTPLMEEARSTFEDVLSDVQFREPTTCMPSNRDGREHTAVEWKTLLAEQVTAPVRWDLCMKVIVDHTESDVELSDKMTLSRLVKRERKNTEGDE